MNTKMMKIADFEIPSCDIKTVMNPLDRIYGIVSNSNKGSIEALPFPVNPVNGAKLMVSQTTEVMEGKDIIETVGGLDVALVNFSELWWQLYLQRHGEGGPLNTTGKYHLAFIAAKDGSMRAFYFLWCDCCQGWNIYECPLESHPTWARNTPNDSVINGWMEGTMVISRQ